eukprot:XP_016858554.1 collagen alpha-1(III) chain-like [Homo sapiens]
MLRFQSLAVSRPLTNWNSLGRLEIRGRGRGGREALEGQRVPGQVEVRGGLVQAEVGARGAERRGQQSLVTGGRGGQRGGRGEGGRRGQWRQVAWQRRQRQRGQGRVERGQSQGQVLAARELLLDRRHGAPVAPQPRSPPAAATYSGPGWSWVAGAGEAPGRAPTPSASAPRRPQPPPTRRPPGLPGLPSRPAGPQRPETWSCYRSRIDSPSAAVPGPRGSPGRLESRAPATSARARGSPTPGSPTHPPGRARQRGVAESPPLSGVPSPRPAARAASVVHPRPLARARPAGTWETPPPTPPPQLGPFKRPRRGGRRGLPRGVRDGRLGASGGGSGTGLRPPALSRVPSHCERLESRTPRGTGMGWAGRGPGSSRREGAGGCSPGCERAPAALGLCAANLME